MLSLPAADAQTPVPAWKNSIYLDTTTPAVLGAGDPERSRKASMVDAGGNLYMAGAYSNGSATGTDFHTVKYSAKGVRQWSALMRGAGFVSSEAHALAVDAAGNVYVAGMANLGSTNGQLNFVSVTVKYDRAGVEQWRVTGAVPLNSYASLKATSTLAVDAAGNVNVMTPNNTGFSILRYNANGAEQWRANTACNYYDPPSIEIDATGGVVTGCTIYTSGYGSGTYYVVSKFGDGGALVWRAVLEADGGGSFVALAVDSAGSAYLTGTGRNPASGVQEFVTVKLNAVGAEQWRTRSGARSTATALAVDSAGNAYVTGNVNTASGYTDYLTIKYNTAGVEQWRVVADGSAGRFDTAYALAIDTAGNVYVTGAALANGYQYLTIKYSAAGSELWRVELNESGGRAYSVAVDGLGNAYLAGTAQGQAGTNYLAIKYSPGGVEQWRANQGARDGVATRLPVISNNPPLSRRLAVDAAGNIYLAGRGYQQGFLIMKLNAAGVEQWRTSAADTTGNEGPNAIAVDTQGNVYVTGSWSSMFLTVKFNANGIEQWRATMQDTDNRQANAMTMAVDREGNVYVSGIGINFPAQPTICNPVCRFDATTTTVKYNASGVQQWRSVIRGAGSGWSSLALDSANNVYLATSIAGSTLDSDYLTVKYRADGSEAWRARMNGDTTASGATTANAEDAVAAMVLDGNGNVYVAGMSRRLNNGKDGHVTTVKYDAQGNEQWRATAAADGYADYQVAAIAVDAAGSAVVSGNAVRANFMSDYLTVKYNPQGVQQWLAVLDGDGHGDDRVNGLALDTGGNTYVTGGSTDAVGSSKMLTVKYAPYGAQLWRTALGGAFALDAAVNVNVDGSGNVVIAGNATDIGMPQTMTVVKYNQNNASLSLTVNPPGTAVSGRGVTLTALLRMLSSAGTVAFSVNGQTIAGCTQRSLSMLAGATDAATAVCIAEVPAPTSASSVNYAATYHYPVNHLSGRTSEEAVVSVTVAASAAANYTDMWWAGPAENGWGVSITQHGDVQFVAIYVYNEGGKPIWYVMPGGTWNADRTAYTGDLYAPISAPFVAYDAARFRPNSPVGSATIAYGGAGTATLSYRIGGISGVKNLQRQLFAADDGQPKLQVNDLWWGGAEQNGWGVNIAQQGRVLFLVWYTYGNDGATTWYAMPGGTWSGTTYVGDLYRTVSSPWLGSAYLPTSFVATKVGTMTLDFADQNNAAMSYVVDGVVQTKMIVRQPY